MTKYVLLRKLLVSFSSKDSRTNGTSYPFPTNSAFGAKAQRTVEHSVIPFQVDYCKTVYEFIWYVHLFNNRFSALHHWLSYNWLIPPLQKLSLAKSHTHPNYSPYSEYTDAQPLRKLVTNKSSVPSALSPINRAFILYLEILTLHTSIGRQAHAQP